MSRYTVEPQTHGEGGFGQVSKGRDNILERDVAVKVLTPLAKLDPTNSDRLRREARFLASLSHPSIPSIYDVVFDDSNFLILFQFINGANLAKLAKDEGAVAIALAKHWFLQIASALDHAHELGIVHRDIKPANIIVTPNHETAYLVDFGIAISKDDSRKLTAAGYAMGTPGYLAPEVMSGEPSDHRADIYALGITLYEVLSGKRFPVAEYEELSVANEAISPQIDDLIRACLLPADKRVPSAKAFAQRLSAALVSNKPLSEILSHGRLHELAAYLDDISASEFTKLPPGQQALILTKLSDVIESDDLKLIAAGEELLELMIIIGLLLPNEEYEEIVKPALEWAFHKQFGQYDGSNRLRGAIEKACYEARGDTHRCIADHVVELFESVEFPVKPNWYLHGLRQIIQTLLANPDCERGITSRLVRLHKAVSNAQKANARSR